MQCVIIFLLCLAAWKHVTDKSELFPLLHY